MKLLYVYVQSFGKLLKNENYKFSNEYIVAYSKNNKILTINKNMNYLEEFYGEVISDITAIVGKNGVGKTTLLNLIGRTMNDRLELSNINKSRKIDDEYFLIYHVKNNIFYFEGVGNIDIRNMTGNKTINDNKTIFKSFYFEKDDYYFDIIQYDNKVNDKILYINNNYIESTHDLVNAMVEDPKESSFLPRVKVNDISLKEWYLAYIDLCKYNMISSNEITMIFRKNENVKYAKDFIVQPLVKESLYNVDRRINYIEENIGDFYSHFMSCIVSYYIELSKKVCNNKANNDWNNLRKKYFNEKKYSKSDYKSIFTTCENNIKNNISSGRDDEARVIINYIGLVNNIFFSLYDLNDYIIQGIDEFQLRISGKNKNDKIEKFFCALMDLKDFINKTFEDNTNREDWKYEKDDLLYEPYKGDLNLELPTVLYRINISTGEKNLIELLSHISYEVKSYSEIQPLRLSREEKTYIILVDEIEDAMHLDWSRNLMNFIITYIEKQSLDLGYATYSYVELGVKVQLIFTTHSPFLLSDLNRNSIVALELKNGITKRKRDVCSFAQNIQRIMNNEFFIQDCYGTFAQNKIQGIIKRLNEKEELNDEEKKTMKLTIDEIGEPLLKNKLDEMYMCKLKIGNDVGVEEIKLINRVKAVYGDLNNKDLLEKLKRLLGDEKL